jgi:hypothetical protein
VENVKHIAVGLSEEDAFVEVGPLERSERFHAAVHGLSNDFRDVFTITWHLWLKLEALGKARGMSPKTVNR